MTRRAAVRPGQSVLILGAAGGIGTAAIQIAKALGATVIAVARREGVAQRLTALGADHVVRLVPGWALRVRDLTDGVGVDHVLDPVGGAAFDDAVRVLAGEGTLLVVGFLRAKGFPRSRSIGHCCAISRSPAWRGGSTCVLALRLSWRPWPP